MILTNCAACAAPLAHTAPRCVRCKSRYCNKTCQHDHEGTLREAGNVAECLLKLDKLGEAEDFLNDVMPIAQRSLGDDHKWTLLLRSWYGKLLCRKADASAIDILEDIVRRSNRVLGPNHPDSEQMQDTLDDARAKLAALDSS